MDDERKVIKIGPDARESVRRAVKIVGEAVCRTIGPNGRNALIDRGRNDRSPLITNDGKTIAKSLRLEGKIRIGDETIECDETVNKAAHTFIEIAQRTDEDAGDGTTGAITLGRAIIEECLDRIPDTDIAVPGSNAASPMALARQLEEEKNHAVDILKGMAEPVETLEQLKQVAFTSLENEEVAGIVAEAVFQIGKDGFATIEEGYEGKVEAETVSGIKIYGKVAAPFMYTNAKRQSVFENAPVLVTNFAFQNLGILQSLFASMQKEAPGKYTALVVLGSKFEADVMKQILAIYRASQQKEAAPAFRILAVKVPSLTDEELEDVAAYLDARFINTDVKVGDKVEKAKFSDLGLAKRITASDDETVIIGGRGLEMQVYEGGKDAEPMTRLAARIKALNETLTIEHDEIFRNKLTRRIEILSGGVAVIRVGAKSDTEKSYLKLKVEDAKNACKCALQEGMVRGGGVTLKVIAEKLGTSTLLYQPLQAVYDQIQKNAGGELEIPDTIKDPAKVIRCQLENAVSVAKILITTETIIADKRRDVSDELKEMMGA